ncbi:MAG: rhodanese-like protein [Mucilaginibacter sp.]|nr:rhodanese-like protein [Mucilaginibacter sp.]
MKAKILGFLAFSILYINAKAQLNQRFDNTNYKAIYFSEACKLIAANPDLLLLDVRSPGEYADTGKSVSYNIGRLNGAVNLTIDSVPAHIKDLEQYKDKTILVYCSHSQRSRIVSKYLGDNGFKNVYSLNGGMTQVNKTAIAGFPCKSSLYTSNLPYKFVGPDDAVALIKDRNTVIMDVRTPTEFNIRDTSEYKNVGRIRGAVNVPLNTIDKQITLLAKYVDKPILIYDLFGQDGIEAAIKLTNAGFTKVNVLFEGINTFFANTSTSDTKRDLLIASPAYKLIGVRETVDLVNANPNLIIADFRPKQEFENKSGNNFSNLGHIKNAVNFNSVDDLEAYLKDKPKTLPILIYSSFSASMKGMAGMANTDLSKVSRQLSIEGYTVYLLYSGLYSVVWASANVESCKDAASILVDHQGFY